MRERLQDNPVRLQTDFKKQQMYPVSRDGRKPGGNKMKDEKKTIGMAAKVGATFGVLAFLVFGLIHGLYISGLGTLALLNFLSGGLLQPTVSMQIISALGILLGVILLAMLSGSAGALFGTVVGYVLESKGSSVQVRQKEGVMDAITFADAGEHETAGKMVGIRKITGVKPAQAESAQMIGEEGA